jgi:enoyl-CoA hydratase/carnithine racemase
VARLTKFEEYADRYPDYHLEKTDDGILLMRMHRDGGPAVWDTRTHHDTANLLNDIAGDRDIRVVIYTGTGESFNANWGEEHHPGWVKSTPEWVEEMGWYGRQRHNNMLDIQAIMIAAVNGPCNIHSELPLMCDMVLASEDAYFQDMGHFPRNISPGDGIQNIWPMVMGRNRWRYAQLTGQKVTAQMAFNWGAVNEVLPKDKVLERAWELARHLLKYSPLVLRHTRQAFVQEFKRASVNDLGFGQFMELIGLTQFTPFGGGMDGIDRQWDDPSLWKDRTG